MGPRPYKTLPPADLEKLVATGFFCTAPDSTGIRRHRSNRGPQPGAGRHDQNRLHVAAGPVRGLRSMPQPPLRSDSQVDYYRIRAIFEPAYDWKNWRPRPSGRFRYSPMPIVPGSKTSKPKRSSSTGSGPPRPSSISIWCFFQRTGQIAGRSSRTGPRLRSLPADK